MKVGKFLKLSSSVTNFKRQERNITWETLECNNCFHISNIKLWEIEKSHDWSCDVTKTISITGIVISNSAWATSVTSMHSYLDRVILRSYWPCDGPISLAKSCTERLRMLESIQSWNGPINLSLEFKDHIITMAKYLQCNNTNTDFYIINSITTSNIIQWGM